MRRMIGHERIVTALIGAALGLPLAYSSPRLRPRALGSLGIGFHLPGQQLAWFVLLAVVAGIGASVLTARSAARLNVLRALQHE
jgi:putative ABC transport system permease protein